MLGYAVHEEVVVRDHHQAPLELLTQILLQRGERAQVWDRYTKVVSEKRHHGLSLSLNATVVARPRAAC
jgi:predicted ABC-type ATPase